MKCQEFPIPFLRVRTISPETKTTLCKHRRFRLGFINLSQSWTKSTWIKRKFFDHDYKSPVALTSDWKKKRKSNEEKFHSQIVIYRKKKKKILSRIQQAIYDHSYSQVPTWQWNVYIFDATDSAKCYSAEWTQICSSKEYREEKKVTWKSN